MFGSNVIVIKHAGFFLRQHNNSSGSIGKALEHRWPASLIKDFLLNQ
jgi:hypothetical protein